MPTETKYHVPNFRDDVLLELAEKARAIAEKVPEKAAAPEVIVGAFGRNLQNGPQGDSNSFESIKAQLSQLAGRLIDSVNIRVPVLQGPNGGNGQISIRVSRDDASRPFLILTVTLSDGNVISAGRIPVLQELVQTFQPIDPLESPLQSSVLSGDTYIRALDDQLKRLSGLAVDNIERLGSTLRDQLIANQSQVTAERGRLAEEHENATKALEQKREALAKREKELDLADSKSSRRKIRVDIRQTIDGLMQNQSTAETEKDRGRLLTIFSVGGAIALGILVYSLIALARTEKDNQQQFYASEIRSVLASLFLGGLIIYAIRWQMAWLNRRIGQERRLLQTSLDLERANWVLESIGELKNDGIEKMPAPLLDAVTRNLFGSDTESPETKSPVEDLTEVLRAGAKSLKLKFGENEITFDRAGIKNIINKAED
jgi:hypothetical protein